MSNEAVYGPTADAAATQYGLDPGLFRRLIGSESSFNPTAINPQAVNGEHASGIAQFLPSTAAGLGVDPFNPTSSLYGAASYLSDLVGKYGLSAGIAKYKGYANPTSDAAQATAARIIGNGTTDAVDVAASGGAGAGVGPAVGGSGPVANNDKSFWQYNAADWKQLFQNSMWGFFFGFLGILLVIFSVYMLARSVGTNSLGAVRKVGGV